MRLLLAFVIFVTVLKCAAAWPNLLRNLDEPRIFKSNQSSKEHWFTQILDHFNPADDRIWKQRYFVNKDHFKPNGPIFLFISGESTASDKWLHVGQMFDDAKRFGAMMFLLEHRFYGSSQPMPNLSVESLAYLNTDQALLDVAYFIEGMNKAYQIPKSTRWIVFGCSYAGSLAAWMRYKYPHLVHAAVSSSGPLLAKLDFPEYIVVVENSLKSHSQACVDVISSATSKMDNLLRDSLGQKKLEKLFNLCDPIDSETTTKKDIANFYESIVDAFAAIVQYNKNNRNGNNITIDTLCDILVDERRGIPLERLAEVISLLLKSTKEKCLDYKYGKMMKELTNVTLSKENQVGGRQWMYQTCTEFGFYQTTTARPNLFSDRIPIEFFLQLCIDMFGPQFAKTAQLGVERTNTIFGALDIENLVSNVVFLHGSIDPWHPLGITKSKNPKAPAIFIEGTAHCANIYPSRKSDLPQLTAARNQTTQLIGEWLKNY